MRTSEPVKGSFRGAVKPMCSCSTRIAGPNVRTCHPQAPASCASPDVCHGAGHAAGRTP